MEPNSKSEIGIGTYGCYSSFKSNILVVSAVKVNLGNGSFLLFRFHCIYTLYLDFYYQAQIYKIRGKTLTRIAPNVQLFLLTCARNVIVVAVTGQCRTLLDKLKYRARAWRQIPSIVQPCHSHKFLKFQQELLQAMKLKLKQL